MVIPNPMINQTKEESKELEWNNKDFYAFIKTVTPKEYIRIQYYTTSKQAWNILEKKHEGNIVVKIYRIMKRNRDFELCIMEDEKKSLISSIVASPTLLIALIIWGDL